MLRKNPNIAIVGASSLLGKELKQMLEETEFPIGRLALLETEEYAGLLQEFASEIQITQVISPDAFDDMDMAFFTCSPEIMNSYVASGARFPDLTIDLTETGREGTMFMHGISDPRALKTKGYFVSPHPAAIVISRVLSCLHNAFGLQSSAVTVLEPASVRGNAGVDELQEQTVNLLNFQQVDSKVFKGQLAFNILSEQEVSERTEDRILRQIVHVAGAAFPPPVITVAQAPVFHSHAFSIFVRLHAAASPSDISGQFRRDQSMMTLHDGFSSGPSPVGVVGTDKIHVSRLRQDISHAGTYSLWVVADNLRIAASNAIHMAENILFAPAEK